MSKQTEIQQVREVLQKFHDGYTTRDKSKLDEFMQLFAPSGEIELIGDEKTVSRTLTVFLNNGCLKLLWRRVISRTLTSLLLPGAFPIP